MSKKNTPVVEEVAPVVVEVEQTETHEEKKGILSLVQFIILSFLCMLQKPENMKTVEDKEFLENNSLNPTPEIADELVKMNVAKMSTIDGQPALEITKYGVRWVLQSLQFGPQFKQLFEGLSRDAATKALFILVEVLDKKMTNKLKKISTKDGKPSAMYAGLKKLADTITSWLEEE